MLQRVNRDWWENGKVVGIIAGWFQGRKAAVYYSTWEDGDMVLVNTLKGDVEPDPRIPQEVIEDFHIMWANHLDWWDNRRDD